MNAFGTLILSTALLGSGILTGCSKSGSSSGSGSTGAVLTGVLATLQGSWQNSSPSCEVLSSNANINSDISVATISNSTVSNVQTFYSDGACTNAVMQYSSSFTFVIGDAGPNGVGNNIDTTPVTYNVLPLTAGAASLLNSMNASNSQCSGIIFVANQSTSIVGKTCIANPNTVAYQIGGNLVTYYSIVNVDTSYSPNRMYSGAYSGANDGSTASKRPTTYNTTYASRQ